MVERETVLPRGFGFLTFSDRCGMENAIREMHGREFDDCVILVNKAVPKPGDDSRDEYGGGNSSAPHGGYRGSEKSEHVDECFKCGRLGHRARDCPSIGGDRGGDPPFSSRSRYRDNEWHLGDRDRFASDKYPPARDPYGASGSDKSPNMNASDECTDSEKFVFLMHEFKELLALHVSTLSRSQTPRATSVHSASKSYWIVDSNVVDHMTDNKSILSDLTASKQSPIQIANGSTCSTKVELGTNKVIDTVYKDKGLYRMEGSPQRLAYLSTVSTKEVHCQLGHPSLPLLKKIRSEFQSISELVCKFCTQGKHVRAPHPADSRSDEFSARRHSN
ncbi:Glycine-rich RNA-binding protein RZ1B-like protein [Drosera capensis]